MELVELVEQLSCDNKTELGQDSKVKNNEVLVEMTR